MSEIFASVGGVGAVAYAVSLLNKVVGPSAKTLGVALGDWSTYRIRNFLRLTEVANRISPEDDGSVHPRVAQRLIDEASWLDDDVMLQYAGGLLAASRTPDGKEERGAYYVRLLGGLTAIQIRLHYAIYSALRLSGSTSDLATKIGMPELTVWLPSDDLITVITPEGADKQDTAVQLGDAVVSLYREGLIGDGWSIGGRAFWQEQLSSQADFPHLTKVSPTHSGVLLYLWAHGLKSGNPMDLMRDPFPDLDPPQLPVVGAQVGAQYVTAADLEPRAGGSSLT